MAQPDTGAYRGIDALRRQLAAKAPRVRTRYVYYEMKNLTRDFNIVTPPEFAALNETLGWCAKAVDALADRLAFRGFAQDDFSLSDIFARSSPDILFDSAVLSAMISSCCFLYISPGEDGFPRLQVLDGGRATGVMDPITGLLREGYAVLRYDKFNSPLLEAYFLPGRTEYWEKGAKSPHVALHDAPAPLLVPVVHRPDAVRPFGHSRISRACISILQAALRTLKRSEVSAEFYSFPQKYVTGLDPDAEKMDKWRATMASFLAFTQNENGEETRLGQFSQQSMNPYTEQLRTLAALFAGETGLTLDDLGFVTDNPSSAEAIKASHENLRLAARKAQRTFGSGFLNAGYLAACVRDRYPYSRAELHRTKPLWEPVFEPDAAMLSGIGDGAVKLNQAVPGYFGKENLRALTGVEAEE